MKNPLAMLKPPMQRRVTCGIIGLELSQINVIRKGLTNFGSVKSCAFITTFLFSSFKPLIAIEHLNLRRKLIRLPQLWINNKVAEIVIFSTLPTSRKKLHCSLLLWSPCRKTWRTSLSHDNPMMTNNLANRTNCVVWFYSAIAPKKLEHLITRDKYFWQ